MMLLRKGMEPVTSTPWSFEIFFSGLLHNKGMAEMKMKKPSFDN